MKKFYMALAAIGLLASCSKENVEPQPKQQEQANTVIDAVDPNTPGALRLSLTADVAPFEAAQESFSDEGGQTARGTELVVGGPEINKVVTYKITPGAGGKVPALLYLYDDKGGTFVNTSATVIRDGKGVNLSLGMLLDPTVPKNATLKRLAEKNMKDTKLSFIIGHDPAPKSGNDFVFTNKGIKKITYEEGKTQTLDNNYLLLKATGLPLTYDAANKQISVANGTKVSLSMQGYLIGVRFRNRFPATMLKHRWTKSTGDIEMVDNNGNVTTDPKQAKVVSRPPLGVVFRIENLSATYQTSITHNNTLNKFEIGKDLANVGHKDANILNKRTLTAGLERSMVRLPYQGGNDMEHGNRGNENFLDVTNIGEFFVEIGSAPDDKKLSPGEQFILVYCPNPEDDGSIGYKSPMKLFYDDSPFSTTLGANGRRAFQSLANKSNAFKKKSTLAPDNKFHFVTFTMESKEYQQSAGIWTYDRTKRFDEYTKALAKYKLN
nr:hypothetical protein [uncultured Porphyromonas sp.]